MNELIGKINAKESTFLWEIPNFSTIETDVGKFIYSPTFRTTYHDEVSNKVLNLNWRIRLYPSGGGFSEPYRKDHISVCLVKLDDIEVSINFSIALLNKNNKEFTQEFSSDSNFEENRCWGWSAFAKKESILDKWNGCLVNDTLIMSCRIYSTIKMDHDEESDEESCTKALINHFDMLFKTGEFSDVTINVQNKELRAHKSILTSLSPVFRAMFENQMKEQNENVVEIIDFEFDTINEMLRYMYARKVHQIEEIAIDLFLAADKYCVKGLKRLCVKSLCKDLDENNALQRLEMAVRYDTKGLKRKTAVFIVKHLKSFNAKKEFSELSSDCKSELLKNIARNKPKLTPRIFLDNGKPVQEDCSGDLINHFDMLFNTGKFSDVTIAVGKEKLQAHKSVVSFFSPVFQALFENEIKDQNESIVEIGDIEFKILKEMLRYIYARKVNEIEEIATDLFIAAEKYSVKGLKKFCEKSLCENLDDQNALQHLEVAVQHKMSKVKQKTIELIMRNLKFFDDKPEFKELSSECKSELLSYIAKEFSDSLLESFV